MDYKKKYEEAMLRMNKWVEGSEIIDPKEVAEYVFPELKESKDEKIRKAVKEAVEYYWSDDIQARTDILDWLEKQGEKKPTKWSEEDEWMLIEVLMTVHDKINYVGTDKKAISSITEQISWLKSLKKRMKGE